MRVGAYPRINGATAWTPASARSGSRCRQVCAESGKPCRHRAGVPDPASRIPKSRSLARTVRARTAGAAMEGRYSRRSVPSASVRAKWSRRLGQFFDEAAGLLADIGETLAAVERVRVGTRAHARNLDLQAAPLAGEPLSRDQQCASRS